jgi:hypothetical protein
MEAADDLVQSLDRESVNMKGRRSCDLLSLLLVNGQWYTVTCCGYKFAFKAWNHCFIQILYLLLFCLVNRSGYDLHIFDLHYHDNKEWFNFEGKYARKPCYSVAERDLPDALLFRVHVYSIRSPCGYMHL